MQGKVLSDERNIAELIARFGGRIEKLFVNYEGQKVQKGEKLATIYSPALVTAQRELLEALAFKETRPSIYKAAKGKLKLWDLTDEQISSIENKGEPLVYFNVLSPISGTVKSRNVSEGDYVKVRDRETPSFLYREVVLGPEAGNFYVIAEGLSEGEEIATNGVFKIDAAAQLTGKPSMMNPEGGIGFTGHDHSGMDMGNDSKKEYHDRR